MKKLLALFLILTLLTVSFAACGTTATTDESGTGGKTVADTDGNAESTENTSNAENTENTGNAEDTGNAENTENTGNAENTENTGNAENTENTGNAEDTGDTTQDDGTFKPVLRFVALSDVHLTDTPDYRDVKFGKMFQNVYAYADAHENYQKVDGIFVVGDLVHYGTTASFTRFFKTLTDNAREGTVTCATLGNHEFQTENTVANYLAASGYTSDDHHLVIGGYHFILVSPDGNGRSFSTTKQNWLAAELQKAAAEDETGKKPIFVFQHQHVKGTVYGSAKTWGLEDLRSVLSRYPQVVDFSGHSHFPINDPRSVWQGTFTAFNTASFKGLEMDLVGKAGAEEGICPADAEGGWNTTGGRSDGGQYYVVEVDAQNRIQVRAFDATTGLEVITPILIGSVGDPAAFTYTNARAANETAPAFAEDATVTPIAVNATNANFRFPRTANGTYVQNYRCEISRSGVHFSTIYRLDCGFLFPAPETLTLPLTGLEPETEYSVRIVPVSSWGNEGEALTFNFTTAAGAAPDSPASSLIFSAVFGQNNTASDAVSGATLRTCGTPKTQYDAAQQKYIGVFDGRSSFEFTGIADHFEALSDSLTFEMFVRMDATPSSNADPFSCQQGGGYGFERQTDGKLYFIVKAGGSWYKVGVTAPETGTWVHVVGTYDGQSLSLYFNGLQVNTMAVTGTVNAPATTVLVVGADATSNSSGAFATCSIGCANVYSRALTASQIAGLYAAYTH